MGDAFWADGRSDEFKEGYALGYHDGSKDDTSPILQDLIAELRNKHCAEPESRLQCQWCESDWPCPEARAADRAKQRLREVSGE